MSVINKMLKDLEQRQEPEVPLGTTGATYQAPAKKSVSPLLLVLLITVIVLSVAVIWLWTGSNTSGETNLAANSKVAATQVTGKQAIAEEKEQAISSESPANIPVEKKSLALEVSVSEQPKTEMVESDEPVTESKVQTASVEQIEPVKVESPVAPITSTVTANTQPSLESTVKVDETESFAQLDKKLKIEKSSTVLTPEQRIERLMDKAQTSFDKGYITEAISQLEEVLASADGHVAARNLLAVAWYGRGELQQAVNILNDGLNRYPSVEMWRLTAAKIYFKENQLDGAFSYLEAELSNASIEYYSMKGTLGRQLKRFDKAESAYSNLTVLEPEKANWWLGYAISLDSQSKSALAIESYKVAVEKSGLSPASIKFATTRIEELQD